MKVLFIKSGTHHKNFNFILNCKKINFYIINSVNEINKVDLNIFDAVISPCEPIDVSKYPNIKFIFGPHFSVFPDNRLNLIKGPKTAYNSLSEWVINLWKLSPVCDKLNLVALPFGVDTDKFKNNKSIGERNKVLVYFKHRNPTDLNLILHILKSKINQNSNSEYIQKYNY